MPFASCSPLQKRQFIRPSSVPNFRIFPQTNPDSPCVFGKSMVHPSLMTHLSVSVRVRLPVAFSVRDISVPFKFCWARYRSIFRLCDRFESLFHVLSVDVLPTPIFTIIFSQAAQNERELPKIAQNARNSILRKWVYSFKHSGNS